MKQHFKTVALLAAALVTASLAGCSRSTSEPGKGSENSSAGSKGDNASGSGTDKAAGK